MEEFESINIAVPIPCHNGEAAISSVVRDFRNALPSATIYVSDNKSTDRTAELAAQAGAIAGFELGTDLPLTCGFILDSVTRGRQELKRLAYLAIPAPGWPKTGR